MTSRQLSPYESDEPPADPDEEVSDRSRGVALALAVFGGVFGLHRFYTGRAQSGVWMCLTLGGLGIWYLYDVVLVAAGEFSDADGRRVARWDVADMRGAAQLSARRVRELEERLGGLVAQVSELAERVDFAERIMAQQREQGQLPK